MTSLVQLPTVPTSFTHTTEQASDAHHCPSCGTAVNVDVGDIEEARRVIRDLEAQMQVLKEKATAAGSFTNQESIMST